MNKIGMGFMVLGGIFLMIGAWITVTAFSSQFWPTVPGTVAEAKVVGQVSQVSDPLRRHLVYNVQVSYDYVVDNKSYQGTRYSLGSGDTVAGQFNEKSEARAWLRDSDFKSGQAVTVYVDPSDPENTVLSAGIKFTTWIPVIMGLLLLGFGYWMVYSLHPKVLSQQQQQAQQQQNRNQ